MSSSRLEALDRQSQDYLRMAIDSASADAGAAGAAYQAGYFALMSALSTEEVVLFVDHPSAGAASLAAKRLQLSTEDRAVAEQGAANYYAPQSERGSPLHDRIAWARRVRAAAHWAP